MTKVEIDRDLLDKAVKEANDLSERVSFNTAQEFYSKASHLGQEEIKAYGLNAKRLILAVRQLFAKATVHTEVGVEAKTPSSVPPEGQQSGETTV